MNAAALGGGAHTPVRWVTDVPAAGAGTVDHEAVLQTRLGDQVQKDPLGGRRAADVAETDKEQSLFSHGDLQSDQCDAEPRPNAFEPRRA